MAEVAKPLDGSFDNSNGSHDSSTRLVTSRSQKLPLLSRKSREASHPSSDLRQVMRDVLRDDPEQAYYFLNEGKLRSRVAEFRDNFLPGDDKARVIYAMKANPREHILRLMESAGIDGIDCASYEEISSIHNNTRIPKDEIYFNNPIRTDRETRLARDLGVEYFTTHCRDSYLQILESYADSPSSGTPEVAARVATSNQDAEIRLSSKFGCSPELALELLKDADEMGMKKGLTMHTGSQNTSHRGYYRGIRLLERIALEAGGVSSLNLGGGFPVNYRQEDKYKLTNYLTAINNAVSHLDPKVFSKNGDSKIIIEPGRALIAEAVDLAIPVLSVDSRGSEKRVFMGDGVFTSFSDAKIHNWEYYFELLKKDGSPASDNFEAYTVHGRTCDGGDTLGKIVLPEGISKGDSLWVKNAGAYHGSQSTGFNGFNPPKYMSYNI